MARPKAIYGKQLLDKKYKIFEFDGVYFDTMGTPESKGCMLIYGDEKQGKTWFSLKFAEYLSKFKTTLYISAEQGFDQDFQNTYKRAGIDANNRKLKIESYISFEEIDKLLKKRQSPKIVFIDNLTTYQYEFKSPDLIKLLRNHPNVFFVFVAHQDKEGEPSLAVAKLVKKFAKRIIKVVGLACFVSGRCNGGTLLIDEEKAKLYHGNEILNQ